MQIPFHGTFSRHDADAHFRRLGEAAFFVQIGVMDGKCNDPIYAAANELHWRGLLVEPVPDMFERLKKNYADNAGLIFANIAIADFEGQIEMTRIDPAAIEKNLLPDVALGISSLMPDRGILGAQHNTSAEAAQALAEYRRTLNVPCCRLQTLLDKHRVSQIDLFLVDTEGADWMVTRQLDLARYRPKIVYLEYCHLSGYEQVACAEHFRNHGYKIFIEEETAENFMAVL